MTSHYPIVTVIIPTYNRSDILTKAIASVLEQDFEDLELLIIDDGSTDNTEIVVRKILANDSRVVYQKITSNRGVGFARDVGLRLARGEYVAWVDSDDIWLPGKLSIQISILEKYPEIDILFGDLLNINHIKNIKQQLFFQNRNALDSLHVSRKFEQFYIITSGLEKALIHTSFIHLQTVIFRASVIQKIGGFDPALGSAEDFEFFMRGALLNLKFAYLEQTLGERHKYPTSLTADPTLAWVNKLEALHRCRLWCDLTGRVDLHKEIIIAQERARRNLIRAHGLRGDRMMALKVYRDGLLSGFSWKALLYLVMSLIDSNAVSYLDRWTIKVET
jgi:glycosyltransferase involved in cell wall biosynthesis